MALIKIEDGVQTPYSMGQLRRDNKSVSFPKTVEADTLALYGVYSTVAADAPTYNDATQVAVQNATATNVAGQWTYEWTVRDKTADELAVDVSNAKAAARSKRDSLLAETDYLALSDANMSAEMATYRQALRDITDQAGFPTNITWPTKPE